MDNARKRPESTSVGFLRRDVHHREPARLNAKLGLMALTIGVAQLGCAPTVWQPRIETTAGEYQNTQALTSKAGEIPEGSANEVKALVQQLPPGVELKDGVLHADPTRYDVIGKVATRPSTDFFYPYHESWRRYLCHPQAVLEIGTLYIWTVVPTDWPCLVAGPTGVEERRDRIVDAMKRATKAIGGDVVLIDQIDYNSATGWALKSKSAPETPEPPKDANVTSI